MRPEPETIRSLVALLEKEGLEEVCYERGGVCVRVRKEPIATYVPPTQVVAPKPGLAVSQPEPRAPESAPPTPPKVGSQRDLLSPMAGIFYRASTPGAEPFVKVGDVVEAGQTVALVEAMKTFNEVAAEFTGRVVKFYVQDVESVHRGQPILALEPLEVEV